MRTLFTCSILFGILAFQSCGDDGPLQNSAKTIWTTSLSPSKYIEAAMFANVQYNGGILLGGMDETGRCLYFLSIEDGSIRWKWRDYLPTDLTWLQEQPYVFENKVLFVDGRHQYCINLDDGTTIWKKRRNDINFGERVTGYKDTYVIPARGYGNPDGSQQGRLIIGNLNGGGSEDNLIDLPYSKQYLDPNGSYGDIPGGCNYLKDANSDRLIVLYSDPLPNYVGNLFLALYDFNNRRWIYDRKPFLMNTSTGIRQSAIIGNSIFNVGLKTLQGNNIATGNVLWTTTLSDVNSAQVGVADGKLIVTTQDRITHCIDPANGKELWSLTTSGNPGIVRELNGIVYFVGGNGKLFAIDVAAGKILWQLDSPDMKKNSGAFWQEGVRIVPGENGKKGKVIVSSYLNGYCYEAIR